MNTKTVLYLTLVVLGAYVTYSNIGQGLMFFGALLSILGIAFLAKEHLF
jgi:hypothetical protein